MVVYLLGYAISTGKHKAITHRTNNNCSLIESETQYADDCETTPDPGIIAAILR